MRKKIFSNILMAIILFLNATFILAFFTIYADAKIFNKGKLGNDKNFVVENEVTELNNSNYEIGIFIIENGMKRPACLHEIVMVHNELNASIWPQKNRLAIEISRRFFNHLTHREKLGKVRPEARKTLNDLMLNELNKQKER